MPHNEHIPSSARIYAWIEEIFGHGIRRPGYPADRWAEAWIEEQFRAAGLDRVRREPLQLPYWEPRQWSLSLDGAQIECFPLPHAAASAPIDAELVRFDPAAPERV